MSDQGKLGVEDQVTMTEPDLVSLLWQPRFRLAVDIGLSTSGSWITSESPEFSSCQILVIAQTGKIRALDWRTQTAVIVVRSTRSPLEEIRVTFDALKLLSGIVRE